MMKRVLCLFVPGVKGTELWCETCGKRAWPPVFIENPIELSARMFRNGFSLRLEDMMNDDDYGCLTNHEKTPTRIVGRVKTAFGLFNREVYASFLQRLEKTVSDIQDENVLARTATFPYDWTRSNVESAHRLYYALVEFANVYDEIVLIAHSMGGLVCRYMLENVLMDTDCLENDRMTRRRLSSKIDLFYGLGVPHYGCVKSLHHLVDPSGGKFSEACRHLASAYEMIPFSDLATQIEGLTSGTEQLKRRRSDVFMRDGEEIIVDPGFWRLDGSASSERKQATDANRGEYGERLIRALISRFPVLNGRTDELFRGLDFHLSLNTARKPAACVYVLVNATGVTSPSGIDTKGQLEMKCSKGDGTVCSVVNRERGWFSGFKHRFGRREVNTPPNEHVYKHNVHVSMLNDVDFSTPIRYFALSEETERSVRNAGDIVGSLVRCKEINRGVRSFATKLSDAGPFPFEKNRTMRSGSYRLNTYNLDSHRLCVISLRRNSHSEIADTRPISMAVERVDEKTRLERNGAARITFRTEGYGHSWNGLHVVLPGIYRAVSIARDGDCRD